MRILIYSHDTYGLGHFRRSLAIAEALVGAEPGASVLIVTGSPRAQSFALPARCDTVKLPTILKQADGSYVSRDLEMSLAEIVEFRARLIVSAFHNFRPDAVLVDHAPLGVAGELEPLLTAMRLDRRGAALVLGMRDIVDDAEELARAWRNDGVLKALEDDYDRILVYGSAELTTTAMELGLDGLGDERGQAKVRHVGYLTRSIPQRHESGRLLVTAGGGGDGQKLIRAFLRFLENGGSFAGPIDIVTGPFLSDRRQAEVVERVDALKSDIAVIEFDDALHRRIADSAAVIGMAGYNTVTEILAAGRPGLLVPREEPRREQLIRAERLAPLTGLICCRMSELDDLVFSGFLRQVESHSIVVRPLDRQDGLLRTVAQIRNLVEEPREDDRFGGRFPVASTLIGGR